MWWKANSIDAVTEPERLGLSVVHGVVAAHGGTIDVQSKLNRGTRFTLSFPTIATVSKAAA